MSQTTAILETLQRGESLTALDALRQHGCLRLAGRVWELRNMGYNVTAKLVDVGGGKRVAEYRLA